MDNISDIKIVGMLGEVNNKINELGMILENMSERMSKNFSILADAQVTVNNKLDEINDDIKLIKFRTEVLESGVGLNAERIGDLKTKMEL